MFKELGPTSDKRSLEPFPREPGGKHLRFITPFNCPACLISGHTLLKGVCGERLEKGRQAAFSLSRICPGQPSSLQNVLHLSRILNNPAPHSPPHLFPHPPHSKCTQFCLLAGMTLLPKENGTLGQAQAQQRRQRRWGRPRLLPCESSRKEGWILSQVSWGQEVSFSHTCLWAWGLGLEGRGRKDKEPLRLPG